jgi:hypothetical protein
MQTHIIERLQVEARADHFREAARRQQQLSFLVHTQGFRSSLEKLFDELVPGEEHVTIDRVSLDVDIADERSFQDTLLNQLKKAIREKMNNAHGSDVQVVSSADYKRNAVVFYLLHGIISSRTDPQLAEEIHNSILALQVEQNEAMTELILQTCSTHPVVWRRLYYMLGANGIAKFLFRQKKISKEHFEAITKYLHADEGALETTAGSKNVADGEFYFNTLQAVWQQVINGCRVEELQMMLPSTSRLAQKVKSNREEVSSTVDSSLQKSDVGENEQEHELKKSHWYVNNAGLVLIWREFAHLLRTLDFVTDKRFVNDFLQQRSILLLHYIVTGALHPKEYELLLCKLLCAWSLTAPVDPAASPEEHELKAADDMLVHHLDGWAGGRKYSKEFVRHNFFARQGRLGLRDDGHWELQVTRNPEDILLDHPTSSINKPGVIRFVWMKKILFVQW